MKKRFLSLAIVLATSVFAFAQVEMPPIPVDPQVRIGHLDNGLTYYIRQNNYPEGQVHFYIAQKVGSILEEENQRGLAHFLEHMCFNGSEHFAENGIVKYCEKIGVKFGADLNAYTSIDETVYNIDNVPTADPTNIDSCLYILYDWSHGLLLEGDDIDKERGVIHEEWRARQNAQMRIYDQVLPKVYPNNKYGQRMPIGTLDVIDNFPYEAIRDYYHKWYRPDQQGIVVVGDINVDEVEAKIKSIFGPIPAPVNPAERYYTPIEDNEEPIIAMGKDKEMQYPVTLISFKHDVYPVEERAGMAYLIYSYATQAIGSMMSQRLEEIIMKPDAPFVGADVSDGDYLLSKTKGAMSGQVITKEGEFEQGVAALYREMLRARRYGFTASEFERVKADYMSHLESAYNERNKQKSANFCHEYVRHFIDNEPIPGIENEYALFSQLLPNIPVDVVNGLMGQLMADNNLVVMSMLPDKEGVSYPTEEELLKVLRAVEEEDIAPYEDAVSDEPLISQDITPGKIVKTKNAKFGYKKLTLSNGATVYLRSTDFKADDIELFASSKGGTSLYGDEDIINLWQMNDMMDCGGLGTFSATDLNKVLAGKKVNWKVIVTDLNEYITGRTTPKDFETMMQLIWLSFTSPRYDEDAFNAMKTQEYTMLVNQEMEPTTALQDSINSILFCNHPRHIRHTAADLDKVDYKRIMDIRKERFANAADFTFYLTGAIDEATALPLIEKYIGSLPAAGKKENWVDRNDDLAKGYNTCKFNKPMEDPKAVNLFVANGKSKYDLRQNVLMDIASQILNIVYTEEIREKEGGTYGVSTVCNLSNEPRKQSMLQVQYVCDPDREEYLSGRIIEILYQFAEEGPREADLAKVKEYLQKKFTEQQKENYYWRGTIQTLVEDKIDRNSDYEKLLASITCDDVRNCIKKLLDQDNFIQLSMIGVAK